MTPIALLVAIVWTTLTFAVPGERRDDVHLSFLLAIGLVFAFSSADKLGPSAGVGATL